MTGPADAPSYLAQRGPWFEEALGRAVEGEHPPELYEPARYALAGRGKRVRPMLTLLSAETLGASQQEALPAALAVEVFHTFTLVHDDIMDRSDSRRGRETVHVRWDEPTAILCGDLLMGIAYGQLSRLPSPGSLEGLRAFHAMMLRLCEGQTLDMAFERRSTVSTAEYLDMIDRKTGALLQCALELGGIVAGADSGVRARLGEIGREIGRAFQIQDDLLDLTATTPGWGKPIGGDLVAGKRAWPLLLVLERGTESDRRWFQRAIDGGIKPEEVPEARRRMERAGVLKETREAVIFHSRKALDGILTLPDTPTRLVLTDLVQSMSVRDR